MFFVFNGPMKKPKTHYSIFHFWLLLIVLLVILAVSYSWLVWQRSVNNFEPNDQNKAEELTAKDNVDSDQQLTEYFASFSDLFSGTAWFDKSRTNLVRDPSAMVFTFQPNIKLIDLGSCSNLDSQCQSIDNQLESDHACIGQKCLTIKNDQLFYQQKQLVLPVSRQAKLLNLNISSLGNRWFVGGVQKLAEKNYQPLAWLFDGQEFTAVDLPSSDNQPVQSQYLGHLAAGGQADSFLILYSAYEGLAWQVNGSEVRNLSPFFGIRINAGGFRPQIIYTGQGKNTTWYVFNQANQPVRWLKFWQNGTDWIEGVLDLSNRLPADSQAAHFLVKPFDNSLQAKIVNSQDQANLWSINDLGFISSDDNQVVSIDLTFYDKIKPRIVGAMVANVLGGWSGIDQQWSLSADGQYWQTVKVGERINFSKPVEQLWWRWQVSSSTNQWQSPCLKKITINYYRL